METINGSVTSPKGFRAAGKACGIKSNGKKDIAIVCSDRLSNVAGVFTTNVVKGHSLQLTMENIKNGLAKSIVINSGNANACVGERGKNDAIEVVRQTAKLLNCNSSDILFNSTGVIGKPLNMNALTKGIHDAVNSLSYEGGHDAAKAIITTDLTTKEIAVKFEIDGKQVCIGGMAKGSGMIHPNMATMISIITTDINISPKLMDKAFKEIINKSFNRISVDGDTSVCDMSLIMANKMANNDLIEDENIIGYKSFKKALHIVCEHLAREIAKDGEGATKLIEIITNSAPSQEDAYKIICAIAKSPLVKTAIFGEDANWGRIITAAGYSGANFDPDLIDIYLDDLKVCNKGIALDFDEDRAKEILKQKEIKIIVELNMGNCSDKMWTCDFSYDYVKINGSYLS